MSSLVRAVFMLSVYLGGYLQLVSAGGRGGGGTTDRGEGAEDNKKEGGR
jgi:hypothetical protein